VHLNDAFDNSQPEASAALEAGAGAVSLWNSSKSLLMGLGNGQARVSATATVKCLRRRFLGICPFAASVNFDGVPHPGLRTPAQAPSVAFSVGDSRSEIHL